MKKAVFSILAVLAVFAMVMTSCDDGSKSNDDTGGGTEYNVTFVVNGGSRVERQTVKSGGKVTKPADPTKAKSEFLGWYKESTFTTLWNFDTDTVTNNINLYAKWKTDPTLVSVIADGSSLVTTTKLILTFDQEIDGGLTIANITLTGVNVTPGTLTLATVGDEPVYVYTLPISFTAGGDLTVKVEKSGIKIYDNEQTVKIMVGGDGTGLTFDTAEGMKEVILNQDGDAVLDPVTGIISCEPAGGWGNAFGIKIPEEYLPVIASDTFVIKYIGTANASVVTKANSSLADLIPAEYAAFTGNNTVQTKRLEATRYGAVIPTDYLWFQKAPNDSPATPWKLKILSVTVEHGDPIPVTEGISKIKPVAGETPVTTLGVPDYLQYTATIAWSSNPATFVAGTAYTATITLTKVAGYTFDGIEADKFPVAGASTVTHAAGTTSDTLTITAVFPAAAATAAPDLTLTFAEGDVKGSSSTVTILAAGTGYRAVTTAGYGGAWTYFKVTFAEGLTLSDYTKISYNVKGIDGGTGSDNTGYKEGVMGVFKDEASVVSPAVGNSAFTETTSWQATGVGALGEGNENRHTVTVKVQPGTDLNEVWIAFRVGGTAGWTYELSDIKFHN